MPSADFYSVFSRKSTDDLIRIIRERATYQDEAVIAAGRLLAERGVDISSIKKEFEANDEPEEVIVPEDLVESPDLNSYKEEIENRFERGADPEAIRLAMKEKGYNAFDMLEKEIESDETLKEKRDGVWKKWAVGATVLVIVLRLLRALLAQH